MKNRDGLLIEFVICLLIAAVQLVACLADAQPTSLNLNGQPLTAIRCDGGVVCARLGSVGYVYGSGASSSSGGPPVDAGFVVWSAAASTGSTNERVLTAGTNVTIDTATPGQVQVDLSGTIAQTLGGTGTGALTCAAGERLTSNGTVYSCSALPAGGSSDYDGGYLLVQDEGADLTKRTTIDFTGAGVTCTDTGSKTSCDIPSGGSGGASPLSLILGTP